jgi:ssDNA-specific exonuclease RecJ
VPVSMAAYADGHKGVAIEVDIPDDHPDLTEVTYSPFSSVFSEKEQTREDMRHLFNGKGEEWAYEEEYRIITDRQYFDLPSKPSRLLLGPMVPEEQVTLLRKVLSDHAEIVTMDLDRVQGTLYVVGPTPSLQPASSTHQAGGGLAR